MRKRYTLKNDKDFHVLTVRFLSDEFQHLKQVQRRLEKALKRRVPYNEIVVEGVRSQVGARKRRLAAPRLLPIPRELSMVRGTSHG